MANVLKLAVALAFVSLLVSAIPQIPESYSGKAYVNGNPAPRGLEISARSASGDEWSTIVASDAGDWSLDITFDDPDMSPDEGALEGELLVWFIQDKTAYISNISEDHANSGFSNTNIVLYSGVPPVISTTVLESTSTSIKSEQSTSTSLKQEEITSTVRENVEAPQGVTTVPGALSNLLSFRRGASAANASSKETQPGSCFDGVRNEGEEAVDCGGACEECRKSDSTVWYILTGVLVLFLFLVFMFFLLFVVYSLAKRQKK